MKVPPASDLHPTKGACSILTSLVFSGTHPLDSLFSAVGLSPLWGRSWGYFFAPTELKERMQFEVFIPEISAPSSRVSHALVFGLKSILPDFEHGLSKWRAF